METLKLESLSGSLLGTKFISSGSPRNLVNPATEGAFHQVNDATKEDIDTAAEKAQKAWRAGWRDLAPGKRTDVLNKLASLIEEHADFIAALDSQSMGKPISGARGEVLSGARTFRFYAGAVGYP